VADRRIKKRHRKDGGEQQADLDWRKINHGPEVLEIPKAFFVERNGTPSVIFCQI
jgi:hypothetical protein